MPKSGFLFDRPMPEPVALENLHARLLLLTGYALALLGNPAPRAGSTLHQDELAAKALQWSIPYIQALIQLAFRHEEEFRQLCPKPAEPETPPLPPLHVCSHKFVDSARCVLCGWDPSPR